MTYTESDMINFFKFVSENVIKHTSPKYDRVIRTEFLNHLGDKLSSCNIKIIYDEVALESLLSDFNFDIMDKRNESDRKIRKANRSSRRRHIAKSRTKKFRNFRIRTRG